MEKHNSVRFYVIAGLLSLLLVSNIYLSYVRPKVVGAYCTKQADKLATEEYNKKQTSSIDSYFAKLKNDYSSEKYSLASELVAPVSDDGYGGIRVNRFAAAREYCMQQEDLR